MNEHSKMFYTIKEYYDTGKWSKKAVRNAVIKPVGHPYITVEEYEEIAEEYQEILAARAADKAAAEKALEA